MPHKQTVQTPTLNVLILVLYHPGSGQVNVVAGDGDMG